MIKHGVRTSVGQWLKPLKYCLQSNITYFRSPVGVNADFHLKIARSTVLLPRPQASYMYDLGMTFPVIPQSIFKHMNWIMQ
jgi:hypothetical protein